MFTAFILAMACLGGWMAIIAFYYWPISQFLTATKAASEAAERVPIELIAAGCLELSGSISRVLFWKGAK